MTKNQIIQHYKDFFDMGLGEGDHLTLDWGVSLIEDFKNNGYQENVMILFEFDCWHLGCGIPKKRDIQAKNEEEAIIKFEELYPDMGYDYPHEA